MIDPNVHGGLLTALNTASDAAEGLGKRFQTVLMEEMDYAIKELSSCLLYPDAPSSELDTCVSRFEQALEHMLAAQKDLDAGITRIQKLNGQFPTH